MAKPLPAQIAAEQRMARLLAQDMHTLLIDRGADYPISEADLTALGWSADSLARHHSAAVAMLRTHPPYAHLRLDGAA